MGCSRKRTGKHRRSKRRHPCQSSQPSILPIFKEMPGSKSSSSESIESAFKNSLKLVELVLSGFLLTHLLPLPTGPFQFVKLPHCHSFQSLDSALCANLQASRAAGTLPRAISKAARDEMQQDLLLRFHPSGFCSFWPMSLSIASERQRYELFLAHATGWMASMNGIQAA